MADDGVNEALKPEKSSEIDIENADIAGRGEWGAKLDFFMSCISYAVGFGTIWRFPYLCYKNGGAVFLIPFVIFLFLLGMPVFFLEVTYGQFSSRGPVAAWSILNPLFTGIGVGMVIITALVCIYFNVILAYATFFMIMSFNKVLPWTKCGQSWNTVHCVERQMDIAKLEDNLTIASNSSEYVHSIIAENLDSLEISLPGLVDLNLQSLLNDTNHTDHSHEIHAVVSTKKTASEEFWEHRVLGISPGIDQPEGIQWELFGCLVFCWIIVFIVLIRGIKSSGKAVYVTSGFPYIVLICFLIRGVTLDGAMDGIRFYVIPDWEKLLNLRVWAEAAMQIFYSVGAAWGALITMSSYNKFTNNCYRDAMLVPLADTITSIFAGFVTFSILGFMAHGIEGKSVEDVITEGPGLVFIVYPEVVAQFFLPQLWSVLFFMMLFMVGIGSQVVMFQTITSVFSDAFPSIRRKSVWFTLLMCIIECLLGLPLITKGGVYLLLLMDMYCSTFALIILSFFELVVIGWIYGAGRLYGDIEMMIGYKPSMYWKIIWLFVTPTLCLFILIFALMSHEVVTYGSYEYPAWSVGMGWVFAFLSVLPVPVVAVYKIVTTVLAGGSIDKLLRTSDAWGPALPEHKANYEKRMAQEQHLGWRIWS